MQKPRRPGTLATRFEVASILGVTKQRASVITGRDDFPRPIDVCRDGREPVWRRADVEGYRDARDAEAEPEAAT